MKTFLKVPQKVLHGLCLVSNLAERYGSSTPISLEEIAEKERISQGFLEEIAALLRAAGIIRGRRGNGGGYLLIRDPRELTVADVITALEGGCWSEYCLGESETPGRASNELWRKVQGQVMTTLYGMTIAEAIGSK